MSREPLELSVHPAEMQGVPRSGAHEEEAQEDEEEAEKDEKEVEGDGEEIVPADVAPGPAVAVRGSFSSSFEEDSDLEDEEEVIPADVVRGPAVAIIRGSTSSNVVDRQIEQSYDGGPVQFLSASSWKEAIVKGRDKYEEQARWMRPSIFLVPEWMKDKDSKESRRAYQPELVSLGPYHHGDPNLLPMERHKHRAVQTMLSLPQQPGGRQRSAELFFRSISMVADTLLDAYHDLDPSWRYGAKRNYFIRMMINDGCFLLEFMRSVESIKRGESALSEYAANDPVFSQLGLISKYACIYSDVLVMENQLPLLVLEQLLSVVGDQYGSDATEYDERVNYLVLQFLGGDKDNVAKYATAYQTLGMHPLDIFHRHLCGPREQSPEWHRCVATVPVPSAVELGEAGIHFKRSNTNQLCDIDFENGVLSMPQIVVRDSTKKELLNLMAFEHLHRDIVTDVSVTDFVSFMDNIIDTETDVELLKKMEVIEHTLGTNMEVANLFNTMKKGAMMSPYGRVAIVKDEVNKHRKKTLPKWRASFVKTYLRNPWVFISLVAASILLIATLLQTVYSIVPYYIKS